MSQIFRPSASDNQDGKVKLGRSRSICKSKAERGEQASSSGSPHDKRLVALRARCAEEDDKEDPTSDDDISTDPRTKLIEYDNDQITAPLNALDDQSMQQHAKALAQANLTANVEKGNNDGVDPPNNTDKDMDSKEQGKEEEEEEEEEV